MAEFLGCNVKFLVFVFKTCAHHCRQLTNRTCDLMQSQEQSQMMTAWSHQHDKMSGAMKFMLGEMLQHVFKLQTIGSQCGMFVNLRMK